MTDAELDAKLTDAYAEGRRDQLEEDQAEITTLRAALAQPAFTPFTEAQKRAMFVEADNNRETEYESYLQGIEDCEALLAISIKETP